METITPLDLPLVYRTRRIYLEPASAVPARAAVLRLYTRQTINLVGGGSWADATIAPAALKFANLIDQGGSLVLTYWPSEFSQIRGQYEFTDFAENRTSNQLLMQLIFSLGAHGAHPF